MDKAVEAPAAASRPAKTSSPRVRIDELAVFLRRPLPNGVRLETRPPRAVTAAIDPVLPDAPERRLFDLQNPEEGLWAGTGKWRLRLFADWAKNEGEGYKLDARPSQLAHRFQRADDGPAVVTEDATRRAGGRRTY